MNPRRRRIEDIFCAASELPAVERDAYLERACGGDGELWREVQALLDGARGATDRIRGAVGSAARDTVSGMEGRRVGPYRLVAELGRGGMGAVYLAHRADDEYRSLVAIKLLHVGSETARAVARFRDERQILAQLDHPGIVRLLDGGSSDGLPYLVMEHVSGVPITRWAEERALSVRARVELVREVCAAVAHAHQKLVVHRDLKPSNILVTDEGRPKLLDFGIAKLLDVDAAAREASTGTGDQLLTPAYASPEQVRGLPVSTATDIYSLGAILYELLAGAPVVPDGVRGLDAARVIAEVDPPAPSTRAPAARRRIVAGDLDNIALKALHKDPARRYASVEQLAADLGRFLDGRPVAAHASTLGYRAGKFAARNRVAVAAALVVVASMSAATVVSLGEARRADAQARLARQRFDDVRRLADSLLFDVDGKIAELEGATGARELIVSRALEYLDRLSSQGGDDAPLARELAAAYVKIGDIQGNASEGPTLGRPRDALASYRKADAILARLVTTGHVEDTRIARAQVALGLGTLLHFAGEQASAHASYERAIAIAAPLAAGPPVAHRVLVKSHLGLFLLDVDDPSAAQHEATACLALATEWQREDDAPEARYFVGVAREAAALAHLAGGEPEAAAIDAREAVHAFEALVDAQATNVGYRRERLVALLMLGTTLGGTGDAVLWRPSVGDRAGAEVALRRAVALADAEVAKDPRDTRRAQDLAIPLSSLGVLVADRDPSAGVALLERARAIYQAQPASTRESSYSQQLEWFTHCALGEPLARLGRRAEALAGVSAGLAIVERLAVADDATPDNRLQRAICRYQAARARRALGEPQAAAALATETVVDLRRQIAAQPALLFAYVGLLDATELLGELAPARRCDLARQAADVWRSWPGTATAYTRLRAAALADTLARCAAR